MDGFQKDRQLLYLVPTANREAMARRAPERREKKRDRMRREIQISVT